MFFDDNNETKEYENIKANELDTEKNRLNEKLEDNIETKDLCLDKEEKCENITDIKKEILEEKI